LDADIQNGKDPGDCDRHQKENLFKTSETTLALYLTSSLDDPVLQTIDRRENACTSGSQTAFSVGANELVGSTILKAC
jgi:hypothetical protein